VGLVKSGPRHQLTKI